MVRFSLCIMYIYMYVKQKITKLVISLLYNVSSELIYNVASVHVCFFQLSLISNLIRVFIFKQRLSNYKNM